MENKWRSVAFGELCEHSAFGPRFSGEQYAVDGNVATLRTTDISADGRIALDNMPLAKLELDKLEHHVLRPGDLVITRTGRVGTPAVFEDFRLPVLPGAFLIRFRLKRDVCHPQYLRYYFMSPIGQQQTESIATGSVQKNLNITNLHRLIISLPPLKDQLAIAHVLSTLDDKIELNRRMNETLEAMARAIFKSWFVDFDPVRAKAEGRDPGLPKHIADLFPDHFENMPDDPIPRTWKCGTLADLSTLNPETWSKRTRPPIVRYVDLTNTKWGRIESIVPYAEADAPSRAQRVLRPLDSIVGTVRPGNGSFAFVAEDGLTGSTGFAVLRPLRTQYAEYVYLASTAKTNIESLQHLADGGAYPAVRPEVVAASAAIRPSEPVLEAFSRLCKPLFGHIAANDRECATLAEIRDALLPKLIGGELRVPDAERMAMRT